MKYFKQIYWLLGALCLTVSVSYAQRSAMPFQVALEPLDLPQLGGLQSYVVGQWQGRWLLLGGRLDGVHQRQPFASFDADGHNMKAIVVEPSTRQFWTAPLSTLTAGIREQLSSTNMSFHQEGDMLYCIGGYGYSATLEGHTTYAAMVAVHVSAAIQAVVNGTSLEPCFRHYPDPLFAVAGGRLLKAYDVYYLVGGQLFDGSYNPMSPTHGPGFTQVYTCSVRKFKLSDDGKNLSITHLPAYTDSTYLHRRDYNVLPQILPNGQQGMTAFSGVFRPDINLPYLDCVDIDSAGYRPNPTFRQYYNHYHCATLPLYSATANEMHSLFFGGIAQYYAEADILVQNNDVPFVKTIARVTRSANGDMNEYRLPVEMPALLGAGAEFIMDAAVPHYPNDVIDLDKLNRDSTTLGYIYGGINSSAPNVFWVNNGTQSTASSRIYKVLLIRNGSPAHTRNPESDSKLRLLIYPSTNDKEMLMTFELEKASDVSISIKNKKGKLIAEEHFKNVKSGKNSYRRHIDKLDKGGVFFVTFTTQSETLTRKVVVEP